MQKVLKPKEVVDEKYSTRYKWVPKAYLTKVLEILAWVPKKVLSPPTSMFSQNKDEAAQTK